MFTNLYVIYKGKNPIKCPLCGNDFLLSYDEYNDEYESDDKYVIHVPRVIKNSNESVYKSELTCPFLVKPVIFNRRNRDFEKDSLASYLDEIYHAYGGEYYYELGADSAEYMVNDFINMYSKMMKLKGTVCDYCEGERTFSYKSDEGGGNFLCSFGCRCTSVKNMPDLSRLAVAFMSHFDDRIQVLRNHGIWLDSIVSLLPKGARVTYSCGDYPLRDGATKPW